jgi:type II secretion system protein J
MKRCHDKLIVAARWWLGTSPGFTFVEMMLAATVFAIVMGTLYSAFRSGLQAYSAADRRSEQLHVLRALREDLNRDLMSAYADAEEFEEVFSTERQGGTLTVSFFSVPGERQLRNGSVGDLRFISYSLSSTADEQGMSLERTVSPVAAGQILDAAESDILLRGLRSAEFSFLDGREWTTEWLRPDQLPEAVRLEFSKASSLRSCRVTVYIPVTWSS